MVHIFKTRYLNYYENIKKEVIEPQEDIKEISEELISDDKKEKKSWFSRTSLYNLKRAQLEAGASIPFLLPEFLSNISTILQSPSAAIKPMNNLLDLIKGTRSSKLSSLKE